MRVGRWLTTASRQHTMIGPLPGRVLATDCPGVSGRGAKMELVREHNSNHGLPRPGFFRQPTEENQMPKKFKFELGERITLSESDETGTVVARAEYQSESDTYYVRYQAADGSQQKEWWNEDDIA